MLSFSQLCVLIIVQVLISHPQCCAWITPSLLRSLYKNDCRGNLSYLKEKPSHHNIFVPNDKLDLKLLLIDHYDSFTFNLVDILAQVLIHPPTVIKADVATTWDDFIRNQCNHTGDSDGQLYDGIVLSPGPGHPNDPMSLLSRSCVLQNSHVPILGVCLGHQILGTVYGATVDLANEPIHGQVQQIQLVNDDIATIDPLWNNISNSVERPICVTRYHSLHVSQLNGTDLIPTSYYKSNDNCNDVLMSMRHKIYPHFGVQFHPESIGTNVTGKKILQNFVNICSQHKTNIRSEIGKTEPVKSEELLCNMQPSYNTKSSNYTVYIHKVPHLPPNGANMRPIDVMDSFLGNEEYTYWLDEARSLDSSNPGVSILGASTRRVEYWGKDKDKTYQGVYVWDEKQILGAKHQNIDIFSYMREQQMKTANYVFISNFNETQHNHDFDPINTLPFDFLGGFVGYFGYESRYDTDPREKFDESNRRQQTSAKSTMSSVPTAAFLWADKSFIFDHRTDEWYLVGVEETVDEGVALAKSDPIEWIKSMSQILSVGIHERRTTTTHKGSIRQKISFPSFIPRRSRTQYNQNFAQCKEYILSGESYELCLTNQIECRVPRTRSTSPLNLYKNLRRLNPAPFSTFFNWNTSEEVGSSLSPGPASAFTICCTSPERFVSVKHRSMGESSEYFGTRFDVEAKPIKGTIRRITPPSGRNVLTSDEEIQDRELALRLQSSIKDRAENLMIVDLLRNDLSQVCETGSVHVSKLMDIESFTTVHQMVSTIRGTLRDDCNAIDVVHACFPGGSMTGAPKIRTIDLLHEIEDGFSRGPYSGCLGYISLNGCMDMNIVIRTAVVTPEQSIQSTKNCSNDMWKVTIGAGGAITALSVQNDEYNEMMLKASVVIDAVKEWASILVDENDESIMDAQQLQEAFTNSSNC